LISARESAEVLEGFGNENFCDFSASFLENKINCVLAKNLAKETKITFKLSKLFYSGKRIHRKIFSLR